MKKFSSKLFGTSILSLSIFTFFCLSLNSCGGASSKTEEEAKTDDASFYETQPVHSGLYDADYYEILGTNPRKGKFDGRIYFSLSPDLSAINVFENGNRTKIDYTITLPKPFEKNDSGIYVTEDKKDRPVCVIKDSTFYCLKFIYSNDTVSINFNPKARHEASAVEILEKINERNNK